jgi:DNA (cytosine-5)-methyltransferase 1
MHMKHASLFSGIGGFDLAAQWMGWENVLHCEINPFGRTILKHHWPNAISYEDITKADFTIHEGTIDVLTGGFPCQPYSTAGKRLGKADYRHLWPEMLRGAREIQPPWIVGENVRGLTNWNGGLVFDEVQADLEALGYEVTPYLLPACAVNAPHRRDRIWFTAYSQSYGDRRRLRRLEEKNGSERQPEEHREDHLQFGNDGEKWYASNAPNSGAESMQSGGENGIYGPKATADTSSKPREQETKREWEELGQKREQIRGDVAPVSKGGYVTNAECQRLQRRLRTEKSRPAAFQSPAPHTQRNGGRWQNFPTQSPVCGGDDGLPSELDGITFSKWRNESIKAYGNAIAPQVALQIFKAIELYENQNSIL